MRKVNWIAAIIGVLLAAGGYWQGVHRIGDAGNRIQDSGSKTAVQPARKILYYRNPMGLPDISPLPKKDAMGMDYVAVYEGETPEEDGAVSISAARVQKLGVQSEAVALRRLNKTIHATGRIEINERHTYAISPKFEGWVEQLYVNSTGQAVTKGQALFDVYSPELVSAQREYAIAAQGVDRLANADDETRAGMKRLADAALTRLANWDITPAQTKQLTGGKSRRNLTYYAPVTGVVLEKKAVQGMRFMPGETLYQIADLSQVWVLADVNEQDIAQITVGSKAEVSISAYPDKAFEGKIAFIYPTLNTASRTIQVRIELANPQGRLMPAMFANVTLPAGEGGKVLTVPASSVIDSGTRQIVLVQRTAGHFAPRTVKIGRRGVDYVEILDGIREGQRVVTSALFLIDAESNLKAALGGLGDATPPAVFASVESQTKAAGHQGTGVLNAVNEDGSVSITHDPVKTLNWPAMTMDFELANSQLSRGIKPGTAISFELVERKPDEWVITKLQARAPHEGH